MYDKLFEPVSIGTLRIKNRFVMPAMGTNYGDSSGFVTQRLIDYYQERAKYQVGLVIVEVTCVSPGGKALANQLAIYDDKFIPGLAKLAESIKQAGAKCFIQLHHAGRAAVPAFNDGMQPVAPSPVQMRDRAMPHELTIEEIEKLIESYSQAARSAKEAGFDGVELHFAHGYLLAQFLSPLTNKRKDKYGGDLISRARIVLEITQRVRETVGKDYPVGARITGDELIKGGLNIKEAKKIAVMLEEAGIDVLNVTACYYASHEEGYLNSPNASSITSMAYPYGCFAHLAEEIKKVVKIPVIAVGRLDDPDVALDVINTGKADLIAIGRGLIADPAYVSKLYNNNQNEIRKCIACRICSATLGSETGVRCTVNPEVGREEEFRITPVKKAKRVLVIGGGCAGMEAAKVAALRGHKVTLLEKNLQLGGNLIPAAGVSFKKNINYFTEYLSNAVYKAGVEVELNSEANQEKVLQLKPDIVILATGSKPVIPDIPGIDRSNVTTAVKVLEGKVETGKTVVVAGGGEVGCEAAVYLAEQGKKVTMVDMRDTDYSANDGLAFGMDPELRKWLYVDVLPNLPIDVIGKVMFQEITDEGLIVKDRDGSRQLIAGDSIVFAAGMISDNSLKDKLIDKVPELYEVGDCINARRIIDAVTEAANVARLV